MSSEAPLAALLYSDDSAAVALTTKVLRANGYEVTTTESAESASQLCRRRRFDMALLDGDCKGAMDLTGPKMPASAPRVVVGIFGGDVGNNEKRRIHFFLQKPLTSDLLGRLLRAARSYIALDRRKSARYQVSIAPLSCTVSLKNETHNLHDCTVVNVSRTGFCLHAREALRPGWTVRITIPVAGGEPILLAGRVMWAGHSGRTGVQLLALPQRTRQQFDDWLDSVETLGA